MTRFLPLVLVVAVVFVLSVAMSAETTRPVVLSRFAIKLDGRMPNQRHNAALCLKQLDGLTISPGETFSFNEAVGSWSRDKGYRRAPVSFGGLLIDSWGGGVCQTSSTLYNAALLAGLVIEERHRHHYAPTYVAPGRDAAVAFPNIDLRITNPYNHPVRIDGSLNRNGIMIELVGAMAPPEGIAIEQRVTDYAEPTELTIGAGHYGRVRNPGHAGYSVQTYRTVGKVRELLSTDSYPVMHKIVEFKGIE